MSASTRIDTESAKLEQPYNPVAKLFHWVVVALLAMQISIALLLPLVLPEAAAASLSAWHLSVGSTILLVMLLRLAWRLTHPPPPAPADLSLQLRMLSRATHWGFYAILIVLPLLGWTTANAYGATVRLLGLIPLPALTGKDVAFAETLGKVHGATAALLLVLIALHVAGVLYHVFVKRDRVAHRMLPG